VIEPGTAGVEDGMSGVWYMVFTILVVVALGLLLARLYREVFFFEGIRLGGRIHTMLYDS
jgi:hypothetical protein